VHQSQAHVALPRFAKANAGGQGHPSALNQA
jgi:hypothetical protein